MSPQRVTITGVSSGIGAALARHYTARGMSADAAAAKIAALVARGAAFTVIPWQMAAVACALRVMPDWLYDRLFANAPRKLRRGV